MKFGLAKITAVKALPEHRLALVFADGAEGVVDCSAELWGEVFEPLKNERFFAKVFLDRGAPTWPNGADFDPGVLRNKIGTKPKKPAAASVTGNRSVRRRPRAIAEEAAAYDAKVAAQASALVGGRLKKASSAKARGN